MAEGGGLSPGVEEGGGVAPGVQEAGGLAQGVQEAGLGPRGQELVTGGRAPEGGGGEAGRPGQWQRVLLGVRAGLQERGDRPVPTVGTKPPPGLRRPREQLGAPRGRPSPGEPRVGVRRARGAEGGSPGVRRVRAGVRGVQERGPKARQEQGPSRRAQQERGARRDSGSPPGRARWWVRRGRQEEGEALRGVQEEGERYRGEQEQPPGTWPPRRRQARV